MQGLLKRISFGHFREKDSVIHAMDPRVKIICVIALSIVVFRAAWPNGIIALSAFAMAAVILSKMSLSDFARGIRPFWYTFGLIFVMYILFSRNEVLPGIMALWRFFVLVLLSYALTFTTSVSAMVAGIESLLKPLKALGLSPRNSAVMISVAIRFIPVMFISFERAHSSMSSRMANMKKFRNIGHMVLLLLGKMLKSASTLSDAMQSRLYDENAISSRRMKIGKYDCASLVALAVLVIFIY